MAIIREKPTELKSGDSVTAALINDTVETAVKAYETAEKNTEKTAELSEALDNIGSKLNYPEQDYCSGSDRFLFHSSYNNSTRKIPLPSVVAGLLRDGFNSDNNRALGSVLSNACPSQNHISSAGFIVGNGSKMQLDYYGSMLSISNSPHGSLAIWRGMTSSNYADAVAVGSGSGSLQAMRSPDFGRYFMSNCVSGMTGWYSDSSNSGSGIMTYHSGYGPQNTSKTGFWATGHGIPSNDNIGSFGSSLQFVMMTGSGGSVNGMSLPSFWNGGHGIQYDSSIGSYSGNLHVVMMTGSGGSVRSISISQFKSLLLSGI